MTVYRVRHLTSYAYESPVLHAHHLAHLRPRRFDYQTTRRTLLEITPAPRDQHRQEDYFGNDCDVLEVLSPHERFDIVATSEVEVRERQELARVDDEVTLEVRGPATVRSVLDALERQYPVLQGTIRDHVTLQRRPFLRFFACEEDRSHDPPDAALPDAVVRGVEPFLVVGAMAGG